MAEIVYVLCASTSVLCAVLLLRGYAGSGTRLLLWTGLCFAGLAVNNTLVYVDLALVPQTDLSLLRGLTQLGAMAVLLYGLVWETG
jgi:hypothetical protein